MRFANVDRVRATLDRTQFVPDTTQYLLPGNVDVQQ